MINDLFLPAVNFGDAAPVASKTLVVTRIPAQTNGVDIEGVTYFARENVQTTGDHYWRLDVGTQSGNVFTIAKRFLLADGIATLPVRIVTERIHIAAGSLLCVRISPYKQPGVLHDFHVALEGELLRIGERDQWRQT